VRVWVAAIPLVLAPLALDSTDAWPRFASANATPVTACEGNRPALPATLAFELRAGAFPGSGHPDVAVHVPAGFDATRRPGVILYFHGWNGCVTTSLADEDAPCSEDGEARTASGLATQIDQAHVNALLVAVELRVDLPTGEPGQLAMPGATRELLSELFSEHLVEPLGCSLDVDALDRIVVIAHSGGYQAAASAIRYGGLAQITEVDLLDSLYGAEGVFAEWVEQAVESDGARLRFVDLYTAAGGTLDRSRTLAALARRTAGGFMNLVHDDDRSPDLSDDALAQRLARPVVFQRVPVEHSQLPRAYVGSLVRAAGFAPLRQEERRP
jgi:hypothetical protein